MYFIYAGRGVADTVCAVGLTRYAWWYWGWGAAMTRRMAYSLYIYPYIYVCFVCCLFAQVYLQVPLLRLVLKIALPPQIAKASARSGTVDVVLWEPLLDCLRNIYIYIYIYIYIQGRTI